MRATGYKNGDAFTLELEPIDDAGHFLDSEAAAAFKRMRLAAELDGIRLQVNSAFRYHDQQTVLWNRYVREVARWQGGGQNGLKPTPVARPGRSHHQSGIAVDINRSHDDGQTDAWLAAHAGAHGFVRTVASELWHWEYLPERAALS